MWFLGTNVGVLFRRNTIKTKSLWRQQAMSNANAVTPRELPGIPNLPCCLCKVTVQAYFITPKAEIGTEEHLPWEYSSMQYLGCTRGTPVTSPQQGRGPRAEAIHHDSYQCNDSIKTMHPLSYQKASAEWSGCLKQMHQIPTGWISWPFSSGFTNWQQVLLRTPAQALLYQHWQLEKRERDQEGRQSCTLIWPHTRVPTSSTKLPCHRSGWSCLLRSWTGSKSLTADAQHNEPSHDWTAEVW